MLVLEGCAQLALAACAETGAVPSQRMTLMAYDVEFTRFVERHVPTTLTARVSTDETSASATAPRIEIVVSQSGAVAGIARMTIGFPA